jgi:hypothetical protein
MSADAAAPMLAPAPDFRYVGLEPGPRSRAGFWASTTVGAATLGAGLWHGATASGVALTLLAAFTGAVAVRRLGGPSLAKRWGGLPLSMGIVPWGIILEPDGSSRVLRWAAVERVHVEALYGRDEGTPTTSWSVVTVTTRGGVRGEARERLVGRSNGGVPLDRLMAHLEAYAMEQAHVVALDLDGATEGEGPLEPEVEPLLSTARAWLASADGARRLDLRPGGYRSAAARVASEKALDVLGGALRDRRAKRCDPRAFAAVCAAELRATELADELVALVPSPHPLIAAAARAAARKLGVATARSGGLDEVAPFVMERDVVALRKWAEEPAL